MAIKQIVPVEADQTRRQLPEGSVRAGLDRPGDGAYVFGKLARSERDPCDNAQAAAAASFESPKQIRMGAGIGDTHGTIGSDDFGFQKRGSGEAIILRETAEPATLNQSGNAHSGAAPALNVPTGPCRYCIIGL